MSLLDLILFDFYLDFLSFVRFSLLFCMLMDWLCRLVPARSMFGIVYVSFLYFYFWNLLLKKKTEEKTFDMLT